MANTSTVLVIDQKDALNKESRTGKDLLQKVVNHLNGLMIGAKRGSSIQVFADGTVPAKSVAYIKLATCAADTVVEVNGVPFTALSGTATVANNEFDIAGSDATDATKLAAAINNSTSAAISGVVSAVAMGADTLTAATAIAGNLFKVTLADTTVHVFYGVAGAATLGDKTFSIDTGDNATAASIVAQINGYAPFTGKISASAASAVVTVNTVDGNSFTLTGTVTTLAETNTGRVAVSADINSALGNAVTLKTLGVVAKGTVTCGTDTAATNIPQANDTVTINGQALTWKATASAANEVTIGATNVVCATNMAAAINLSTNSSTFTTHVRALARSNVVHVISKYAGTIGNACALASSNGTRLALAVTNGRLAAGTEASSGGAQASATLTLASVANAETCAVNGVTLTAHTNTDANDQFRIDGTDTADAEALVRAINNSTTAALADVIATNSGAVVTVKARKGGTAGNTITISSAQGTIVASAARLGSGAAPTTVVPSADRLAAGTGGEVDVVTVTI